MRCQMEKQLPRKIVVVAGSRRHGRGEVWSSAGIALSLYCLCDVVADLGVSQCPSNRADEVLTYYQLIGP